jgi:hypothetical protein
MAIALAVARSPLATRHVQDHAVQVQSFPMTLALASLVKYAKMESPAMGFVLVKKQLSHM